MDRRRDHSPPARWQDFEDLCLKLWRPRLDDAKKNGRAGQPQAGVDIFGRDPTTEAWIGIQCKQKGRWPPTDLKIPQIEEEIRKAESFEPPVSHFIIATTAERDVRSQEFVRELSDRRRAEGKFSVDLFAWDDLQDLLHEGPEPGLPVIPPPTRDFAGRTDELEELRKAVREHGGAMIYGVRGLGGIGKTELGFKLVELVGDDYPDGHILVELGGTSDHRLSTANAMALVIRAYEPQARLPEVDEDLLRIYHQVLKNRKAIVLLDDAAGAEQVEPVLPHTGCLTLVTSRKRFALPGLHRLDLDALSPEAAQELLLSLAPRLGAEAARIAKLLGRLPLALRLAGSAFAERPDLEPGEYVRRLEERSERVGLVEAAISFNYEKLEPELQQQWRALAVFPSDFGAAGAGAVWAMEAGAAKEVLGSSLYRVSMVEIHGRRYRLHDLARDFATSRLNPEERELAARRHAKYYLERWPDLGLALFVGAALLDPFVIGLGSLVSMVPMLLEWHNIRAARAWAAAKPSGDDSEG
ncbi:MAG: hypothetical protein GY719_21370 [bacterium]|nr:hypothetical protein [bacterium]